MGIHASAKIMSLTAPEIREARLRAEVRGECDPRVYAAALDVLESVLDQLQRGDTSLRELDDAFDVAETIAESVGKIDKREEEAAEAEDTTREEVKKIRAEADERCAAMDLECRALRARAERAEHALEERDHDEAARWKAGLSGVGARGGTATTDGTGTLLRDARLKVEELERRIGDQDRMLSALARVVAARDLGADAQTLALSVLGPEEHRRLARAWKVREEATTRQDEAPAAAEPRKRAARKRSEKKATPT